MSEYKSVLVAVDMDDEHASIIEAALKLAPSDSKVYLIHAVEPFRYMDVTQGSAMDINEASINAARTLMTDLAKEYSIPQSQTYVELGRPASEITSRATENGVDLIVVGSHGRHGLQLLLGSTANAVLHGAPCDVLAVRVGKGESA